MEKYKPERCEKAIFAYINTSFRIDKDLESQISYFEVNEKFEITY